MVQDDSFMVQFDQWAVRIREAVEAKGPVPPGRYRAYGHEAPGHAWVDVKLGWRTAQMAPACRPPVPRPKPSSSRA